VHQGGLSLLKKILRVISGALVRSAAARGEQLNARPYYRLFLGIIAELAPAFPADPQADPVPLSYIAMVALVLEELQPARVPGFAFPWLELISHRWAPRQLTSVSKASYCCQTSLRGR
jgi:CCR4-NOT transcription complex subunit 1